MEHVYENFDSNKEIFDFSNYSTKSKYFDDSNKSIKELVALKPKNVFILGRRQKRT